MLRNENLGVPSADGLKHTHTQHHVSIMCSYVIFRCKGISALQYFTLMWRLHITMVTESQKSLPAMWIGMWLWLRLLCPFEHFLRFLIILLLPQMYLLSHIREIHE